MAGSLQLRDYPSEIVRLSCEKCGRAGQYRKQTLIERYGADMRLPDLREEIAQCRRQGQMHDACMVRYIELPDKDAPIGTLHASGPSSSKSTVPQPQLRLFSRNLKSAARSLGHSASYCFCRGGRRSARVADPRALRMPA